MKKRGQPLPAFVCKYQLFESKSCSETKKYRLRHALIGQLSGKCSTLISLLFSAKVKDPGVNFLTFNAV